MKNTKNKSKVVTFLRQKAEELQPNKIQERSVGKLSEAMTLKHIHELEVHQIELEMRNQELLLAKERAEIANLKYTELYDCAPSGYFTLSNKGKIIDVNLEGSLIFVRERSKLIGGMFGLFVSKDTKNIFNLFLDKIFKSKVKESCELSFLINDSTVFYGYLTGVVAKNQEQCLVTLIDITELKKEEVALRNIENRYRDLLINLDQGIVIHAPNGSVMMCNPNASELLSLSEDEMKGKKIIDSEWEFLDENNAPLSLEHYPVNQILTSQQPLKNFIAGVKHPPFKRNYFTFGQWFPKEKYKGRIN
jgi:PAS domain-containing protein